MAKIRSPAFYDAPSVNAYRRQRRADPQLVALLAARLGLTERGLYLDIGCGTGNYMKAMLRQTKPTQPIGSTVRPAGRWLGVDPSPAMLAELTGRSVCARAESLPFANAVIDGAMSVLALHHFTDVPLVLKQTARILKPGAALVLLTATRDQAAAFWLADYLPDMIRHDGETLPRLEDIKAACHAAGFTAVSNEPFTVSAQTRDRFFYSGAARPEIYLSAEARAAMSPFRLAENAELKAGLARLAEDVADGTWQAKYGERHQSHYTIVRAEKPAARRA